MIAKQVYLKNAADTVALKPVSDIKPNLVLAFGSVDSFAKIGQSLKTAFPSSIVLGCTTAGEITNDGVSDHGSVVTGVQFQKSNIRKASATLKSMEQSRETGLELGKALMANDLKAVLLFSVGHGVNGSALVEGVHEAVGKNVILTGGLAGDGGKFQRTFTILDGEISDNRIVAVGFYGDSTRVHFGSMGGWEPFGPVRKVTKSVNNVLYELDGKPALAIYKEYLGEQAKDLPASGLLFPFALLKDDRDTNGLIRTILGIDEKAGSLTLAGDMPQGSLTRLMHAKSDGLISGAKHAAEAAGGNTEAGLAVLVSCVGRKIVLGDDVEEEIDAVRNVYGNNTVLTGFYSYGEICPLGKVADCKLHNQTMTITYIHE